MAAARLLTRLRATLPVWSETLAAPLSADTVPRSSLLVPTRAYISQVGKTALDQSILQNLDSEIQYELERFPPRKPLVKYFSFAVDEKPGEQWMCLRSRFGDKENIKVEVTMFDGSPPAPKVTKDKLGEDVQLHITFIVSISKGIDGEKMEFLCSAWPDSIEIRNVAMHNKNKLPSQTYTGPLFKDLDDELQDAFYYFLEERGVTDDLAVFLHQTMKTKAKSEYILWMGDVKSYI
uniref:Mitochondrial glycoprotein n=1 Tax=Kalanchoe fedtschenkoi TaxID=63787 RepID=A0A7N0UT05_KALFE